jgi:hypothetical protein
MTSIQFRYSQQGKSYEATADSGPPFFVGKAVSYLGNRGITNISKPTGPRYQFQDNQGKYGFWAAFIATTAKCESNGHFSCINTYDRAHFTFSFMQYAAHVPDGDFVKFFRRLLLRQEAKAYFPDLNITNNKITRATEQGQEKLETSQSTEVLMQYLNPSLKTVDDAEVINCCKFIHWANNEEGHRELQVEVAIEHIRSAMKSYDKSYNLHGKSDKICAVVADIRHQGRGKSSTIRTALASENPYEALLGIGAKNYAERVKTLRAELERLTIAGVFGQRSYDSQKSDFV